MSDHIVTGPVAIAEFEDGASRYLYRGALVPKGCVNVDHLVDVGLLSKVEVVEVEVTTETVESQDAEPPRSGKGSGVEAWREYAEAKGVTFDAEATRDDIIALVDGQQA